MGRFAGVGDDQVNSVRENSDHSDDNNQHGDGGRSSATCRGSQAGFDVFVSAPQGVSQ
jgi:hypothetical protein